MKILVNASNLVMGGAIQVARSLIIEFSRICENGSILTVVSPQVAETLPDNVKINIVAPSPAKPIGGRITRKTLSSLESRFQPDVTLTVFGPAYWKPQSIHVCGFANAWIFSSNRYAWKTRSFIDQALVRMKCLYKRKMMVRDNVDVFITETNSMADSIRRTYPGKDVFVVANNCGEAFYTAPNVAKSALMPDKVGGEFRIVTLSQYYPHKNLELVPRVASILCKKIKGRNPVFFLPLAEESKGWKRIRQLARRFGVASHVRTVGPVNPANAPMFYTGADAMLLPSVLETFSANYPEAMICGVPIVTTDLPFARDICGDAAVFFRPMDAVDAAIKIKALVENHNLRNNLVINGYKRLKLFPTPEEKARLYLDACRSMWMKAKS